MCASMVCVYKMRKPKYVHIHVYPSVQVCPCVPLHLGLGLPPSPDLRVYLEEGRIDMGGDSSCRMCEEGAEGRCSASWTASSGVTSSGYRGRYPLPSSASGIRDGGMLWAETTAASHPRLSLGNRRP